MKRLISLLLALAVTSAVPQALTAIRHGGRLYLKLATNRITTSQTDDGEEIGALNEYAIRGGDSVEIWIADPNPLVFQYEATTTTTDTDDYKSALAFATQLAALLARFPGSAGGGRAVHPIVEGLDLDAFRASLNTLELGIGSLQGWIDDSLDPKTVDRMKQNVKAATLTKTADDVQAGYAKLLTILRKCRDGKPLRTEDGDEISCDAPFDFTPLLAERAAAFQAAAANRRLASAIVARDRAQAALRDAEARVATRRNALETARSGGDRTRIEEAQVLLDNEEASTTNARSDEENARTAVENARSVISVAQQALPQARQAATAARAAAAAGQTIHGFAQDAFAIETHEIAAAKVLRGFDKDVDAINVARKVEERPYSLKMQTIAVKVNPETKYDDYLSSTAKDKRTKGLRTINITVRPHAVASLRPGVGFVLGFLRNPTFTATKSGDVFRIVQNDTPLTRYSVAAMLNIVPRGWDEPTFGGYFQVGISPKTDETGILFGVGLSAQSLFTFGGGLMIQQVRALAPGLSVGGTIASPDDLKVQHVFKPAFYVHGTVTIPK